MAWLYRQSVHFLQLLFISTGPLTDLVRLEDRFLLMGINL